MKTALIILGFLNGGFMLIDGLHVIIRGKYIGPEEPGPWAELFYQAGIDVFRLGPLFIVFGLCWLVWLYSLIMNRSGAFPGGIIISFLTLWYLPAGTLISILVMVLLIMLRRRNLIGKNR